MSKKINRCKNISPSSGRSEPGSSMHSSARRIAGNTLMLYCRQILIMLVSLYTVRVILNTLGAEDYGIYNVVAGIVTMFGFMSGAMASASQRFFCCDLGANDFERLNKTFSMSLTIYISIAVLVILAAETAGLWFVYNKLAIPPERVGAAHIIYQAAVFSFACTMVTTPFMSSIIAHEDMNIYAGVSILEAVLKLGTALVLPLFSADKLALYGVLTAFAACINTAVYRIICRRKYSECRFRVYWNTGLFKELAGYTGWNLFGAAAGVFKIQAVNVVLNQFFNPVVIAARGIASQVSYAVNSFAQNFSTAVRPQIIKNYAASKQDETKRLVYASCKSTFILMYLFTLPLCFEMSGVLRLWLKEVPDYAVMFTRLALTDALLDSVSYPIMAAVQATGKIKLYQAAVGGLLLLNLPVSYIGLRLGAPAVFVFAAAILLTSAAFFVRLIILSRVMPFSVRGFLLHVILPLVLSAALSAVPSYLAVVFMEESFFRLICTVLVSTASCVFIFGFLALSKSERQWAVRIIRSKLGGKNG